MASKILNPREQPALQPAYALWNRYQPEKAPYHFDAQTPQQAQEWQTRTRQALNRQIGFQDLPAVDPQPELIEVVDRGDYLREKVLLRTAPDILMPVYLLIPKEIAKPAPTVVAFAGHGYGVKDIIGLWEDGAERYTPDGYHKDFAVALCQRGFVVAAPEISCFGERQTDFSYLNPRLGQENPGTCTHTAMLAFHQGGSVIGLRVHDGKCLVDYLATRPEVDIERLGAMGISGGGMHTFYSTCLDERIRACVVSGYYSTFQASILSMHHCACNFVPGLAQFGEMYDLVGLIAPRPMLVESGDHDGIFPRTAVVESVARARSIYAIFGAQDRLEVDYFEGRHQISGRWAYDFLAKQLMP